MATIKELTEKVQQWSIDRGLDKADPFKQCLKLIEEYGELVGGFAKGNDDLIKDSIGDMMVVITILAQQVGIEVDYQPTEQPFPFQAYEDVAVGQETLFSILSIINSLVTNLLGSKRKDLTKIISGVLIRNLRHFCLHTDLLLEECFQLAYDEIKDRKGKMVDGVFIKEADL